jgi:hypothetical protein
LPPDSPPEIPNPTGASPFPDPARAAAEPTVHSPATIPGPIAARPAPLGQRGPGLIRRASNWWRRVFLLEDRLREAAKRSFGSSHPAWPHFELGCRLLASADALAEFPDRRAGALVLYREALLSALRARVLRADPQALGWLEQANDSALWDRFAATPLGATIVGGLGQAERTLVRDATRDSASTALVRLGPKGMAERTRVLGRMVRGLVQQLEREATALAWVRTVRRARFAAVGLVLVVLGVGAFSYRGAHAPPGERNLARGKPVTASSFYREEPFPTARLVDGNRNAIGFHTEWEENPSVTIDLMAPEHVHRVVVYNRNEYRERAVPMIVETSADGKAYREFARRDDTFAEWEAKGATVQARYVRLRITHHSCLHLNEVEVY